MARIFNPSNGYGWQYLRVFLLIILVSGCFRIGGKCIAKDASSFAASVSPSPGLTVLTKESLGGFLCAKS